jgi:dihydrofolate reductase
VANAGAFLMGRKLYDEWSSYWPEQDQDTFADFINQVPKYVLSTTLTDPAWQNTTVISDDAVAGVHAVKDTTDGAIAMSGSAFAPPGPGVGPGSE